MADGTFKLGYDLSQLEADGHRAGLMARQHGAQIAKSHAHAAHEAKEHFKEFGKELMGMAAVPLTAIGAIEGLHRMGEHFEEIGKTAKMLDTTPEAVQRLQFIAAGTNTELGTLANGLIKVERGLLDVNNEAKQRALADIGIDAESFFKLDADKQFIQLAHSFQTAEEGGKGIKELFDVLGKSAPELLPALRASKEELEEFAAKAVASAEMVEMFEKNMDRLKMTGMSATNGLANFFEGVMNAGSKAGNGLFQMFTGGNFMAGWHEGAEDLAHDREAAEHHEHEAREKRKEAEIARIKELQAWRQKEREETLQKSSDAANDETPQEKLVTAQKRIADITAEIAENNGRIAQDDDYRLKRQIELNGLMKEERDLKKQTQKSAEGVSNTEADIRIQELKNSHRGIAADKLKKAEDEKREFQRLRDAHPEMGDDWAHNMARRSAQAKDDAAHPGRVHGVAYKIPKPGSSLDWLYHHNQDRGGASLRSEMKFQGMDQMTRGIGEIVELLKEK